MAMGGTQHVSRTAEGKSPPDYRKKGSHLRVHLADGTNSERGYNLAMKRWRNNRNDIRGGGTSPKD